MNALQADSVDRIRTVRHARSLRAAGQPGAAIAALEELLDGDSIPPMIREPIRALHRSWSDAAGQLQSMKVGK